MSRTTIHTGQKGTFGGRRFVITRFGMSDFIGKDEPYPVYITYIDGKKPLTGFFVPPNKDVTFESFEEGKKK